MSNKPNNITAKLRKLPRMLVPVKTLRKQASKRAIAKFAESLGWVYFGHVDQMKDEHVLVRGFTASAKHYDTHYCVGAVGDYNVIMLQRTDAVSAPNKPSINYSWIILKIDLKTKHHPHLFATAVKHAPVFYEYFFTKHYYFRQVPHSQWRNHSPDFTQDFTVFATQDKLHTIPEVLAPHITATLGRYFRGMELELANDTLYLYVNNYNIDTEVLERLIRNGIWLAEQIDTSVEDASTQ